MRRYFTWIFVKPYLGRIILYFILVCLATIFSIASILSASNFLNVLFSQELSNNVVSNPSLLDGLLSSFYSKIIAYGRENALYIFGALIFVIYFLKDIFTYLASFLISSVRNKVIRNIRNSLFHKFITLPLSYFSKHRKGDLLSRLSNDVIEYDENVLKSIMALVSGLIIVVLYLTALFYIDYSLTLTVLVVFPIVAFISSFISRNLRRSSKILQQKSGNIISIIEQTISGLRIIKAHTAIELMNDRFVHFRVDLASPISEFLGNAMVIGLLLFGSSKVLSPNSSLSPELFIVYLILFTMIIKPAKDIPTSFFNIKKGKASIERIVEIIEIENQIIEPDKPISFPKIEKGIIFKDVCFSYEENLVLKNINIVFEKGKTTAIVGASGSGKSTLIDLIPKLYEPTSGEILFDNISSKEIHSKSIRDNIAFVTQDTILFNDSIFNNITFGSSSYSMEQVKKSAEIARADSFIEKLPNGYNTFNELA